MRAIATILIVPLLFLPGCSLGPSVPLRAVPAATGLQDVSTVKAVGVQAETATGIDYTSAMPLSLGALLGLVVWLSHKREMARIGQNGKSTCRS